MRFHFWGVHRSTVSGSGCDGLGLRHSNKVACLAFLVGENIGDLGAGDDGAAPGCFVTDTGPGFVMMSGDVGGVQRSTTSAGLDGPRRGGQPLVRERQFLPRIDPLHRRRVRVETRG
jgi:hypothetical protein